MSLCASCGLPGHRYGRNEGMERYDPMACINQLRAELERREITVDYVEAWKRLQGRDELRDAGRLPHSSRETELAVRAIVDAALARGDTRDV